MKNINKDYKAILLEHKEALKESEQFLEEVFKKIGITREEFLLLQNTKDTIH